MAFTTPTSRSIIEKLAHTLHSQCLASPNLLPTESQIGCELRHAFELLWNPQPSTGPGQGPQETDHGGTHNTNNNANKRRRRDSDSSFAPSIVDSTIPDVSSDVDVSRTIKRVKLTPSSSSSAKTRETTADTCLSSPVSSPPSSFISGEEQKEQQQRTDPVAPPTQLDPGIDLAAPYFWSCAVHAFLSDLPDALHSVSSSPSSADQVSRQETRPAPPPQLASFHHPLLSRMVVVDVSSYLLSSSVYRGGVERFRLWVKESIISAGNERNEEGDWMGGYGADEEDEGEGEDEEEVAMTIIPHPRGEAEKKLWRDRHMMRIQHGMAIALSDSSKDD